MEVLLSWSGLPARAGSRGEKVLDEVATLMHVGMAELD
jgi:hypothetical protein